jgi:hypothetical protein
MELFCYDKFILFFNVQIQGLENSQKTQQVHLENPSNYQQLFTKLFDIILTLCAIFLLILNSIINSLKYFFSSV